MGRFSLGTSRWNPLFFFVLAGALLWSFSLRGAAAAAPSVSLQVVPSSIELAGEEMGSVMVIARNEGDESVSDLRLSWLTNSDVTITTQSQPTELSLPANAEVAWELEVAQADNPETATVHLRLDYLWELSQPDLEDEVSAVHRVVTGDFQVTAPPIEAVQEVASVELRMVTTPIDEKRAGAVNLIIKNEGDTQLRVEDIATVFPADILELSVPAELDGMVLQPEESRVFPVAVTAKERVRPGKHLLLFALDLSWNQGGYRRSGTYVVSQEIDVGVFGESQVLTLLGVPAFFLLPGFLIVAAFQLLWNVIRPQGKDEKFPVSASSSEFWLVAITLSLTMAILFPLVTERDYLESYGLTDILYLWFVSIVIGALAYILIFGARGLWRMYQAQREAARRPVEGDTPAQTLGKLATRKASLKRERVTIKVDDCQCITFLLQDRDLGANEIWMAPKMYITNIDSMPPELQTRIEEIVNQGEDAKALEEFLPRLSLKWHDTWPKPGPYPVKVEDIQQFLDEETIIEVY